MKKIILNENSIIKLKESINDNKLPEYVYKSVKEHNTSLGDSPAFPPSHDYSFDYKILKERYSELIDDINTLNLPLNEDEVETLLSKLTLEIIKKEKAIRPQLNKLVYNVVTELFAIPNDTINLKCELVDKIIPKNALRILPEDNDGENDSYTFSDVDEISQLDNIVQQRRFVDCLIQGYSMIASRYETYYYDFFEEHNLLDLLDDYKKVNVLNDYLTFIKKEKIDKKNPHLVSYVAVHLGHGDNKTDIKAQGIIFPYLLKETIRGFMELFSSHGLPEDNAKAQMIIKRADFTMAEPWDIRFGKSLWLKMFGKDNIIPNVIPLFFSKFCSLDTTYFFNKCKELLAKTKKGEELLNNLISKIENSIDYQSFIDDINQKNVDSSLITDGYLTADELDNYTIQEEDNIEENQENEYLDNAHGMPLKNYFTYNDNETVNYVIDKYKNEIPKFLYQNRNKISADEFEMFRDYVYGNTTLDDLKEILLRYDNLKKEFVSDYGPMAFRYNQNGRALFDYKKDIHTNKQWLIHFTNKTDAENIAINGFIRGTTEFDNLLVTHGRDYDEEGYNFAFIANEATNTDAEYYLGYLNEDSAAVMFQANGVEAYHQGDEQNQVIFWGPSAKNIVPIYYGSIDDGYLKNFNKSDDYEAYENHRGFTECWYVLGKNNRLLYSNDDISYVVDWVTKNYYQYRKGIFSKIYQNNDYLKTKYKIR